MATFAVIDEIDYFQILDYTHFFLPLCFACQPKMKYHGSKILGRIPPPPPTHLSLILQNSWLCNRCWPKQHKKKQKNAGWEKKETISVLIKVYLYSSVP